MTARFVKGALGLVLAWALSTPAFAQLDPVARGLAAQALTANAPVNATPSMTNLNPALLSHYRASIANTRAGISDTVIQFIGDSVTVGANGTSTPATYAGARATSTPVYLSAIGVAGLPTQAQSWFGAANLVSVSSSLPAYDTRVVFGAGWAQGTNAVPGDQAVSTTTVGGNLDFTPTIPIDTCLVFALTHSGQGNFTVAWDGGTPGAAQPLSSADGITAFSYSAPNLGNHKISVAMSAGSGISIAGEECYNSTVKSVRIRNMGWAGATAANWTVATNAWSPGSILGSSPYNGALCIIDLGINDWLNTTAPATFTTAINTTITNCQKSGDVILVLPFPTKTSAVAQAAQNTYRTLLLQAATTYNVPVLDWQGRVVSWTAANTSGFAGLDNYHPTPAGYADFANFITQAFSNLQGTAGAPVFAPLTGTTASLGGGALTVGTCTSGTVTVTGASVGMTATAVPLTYPGDGIWWDAYVSSSNTVTVKICASASITPTASLYNVRVTP